MRLIDADALQALFNEVSTALLSEPELRKDTEHMVRAFLMTTEMIQDAQTVDAVPVVRCKDCRWYDRITAFCDMHSQLRDGGDSWDMFADDDFCSDGERRTNDDD